MTSEAAAYDELVDWLIVKVARYLDASPDTIGIDTPLADCGVDSIAGMALCADLNCERGFDVETTVVWDCATINAIAIHLLRQEAPP
jgi:aryl carrier-like protein